MLDIIVIGFAMLVAIAATVGIMEHAQAGRWRRLAASRRANWESDRADMDDRGG